MAGFVRAHERVTQPTCATVIWDDEHCTAVFKSHTSFCACEVSLFSWWCRRIILTLYLVLAFRALALAFFSDLALTERKQASKSTIESRKALHKAYSDEVSSLNACNRDSKATRNTGRGIWWETYAGKSFGWSTRSVPREDLSAVLPVKSSSGISNALQPVLDLQMFYVMWGFGYSKIPYPLKKVLSVLVFP